MLKEIRYIIFLLYIIHLTILPVKSWSSSLIEGKEWGFYKISKSNLLQERDSNVISQLSRDFSKVTIAVNESDLVARNELIDSPVVCYEKYVLISKEPISFFHSSSTLAMYKRFFDEEGINFPVKINFLTGLYPESTCAEPYSKIIEVNDLLVLTQQDYLLFFKEKEKPLIKGGVDVSYDEFSKYCISKDSKSSFDGTKEINCFFKNHDLKKAYGEFRKINSFAGKVLKKELPVSNDICEMDSSKITYLRKGGELKIRVKRDAEDYIYTFHKEYSGVKVNVKIETEY